MARPRVPMRHRNEALRIARRMAECCGKSGPAWTFRLVLLMFELLLLMLEGRGKDDCRLEATPEKYSRISAALELAFSSRRLITNEEAARACGLSCNRFIRQFRMLMGFSFANFALRHRIYRAATDLAGANTPIKAIALRWGFTDKSHLHRYFLRYYGRTPLQYRQSHRA